MMASHPINVLLVEDEPVTRRGLQLFIQQLAGIEVVGMVDNGEAAQSAAIELQPDVILLDIGLPGIDGIAAAREIKSQNPERRILMLTANHDPDAIFAAFGAGADGYVLKTSFAQSLELAIRTVRCGSVWLDPQIAQSILQVAIDSQFGRSSSLPGLSKNEKTILNEVASATCDNGICFVQPAFLNELKRFRSGQNSGMSS